MVRVPVLVKNKVPLQIGMLSGMPEGREMLQARDRKRKRERDQRRGAVDMREVLG